MTHRRRVLRHLLNVFWLLALGGALRGVLTRSARLFDWVNLALALGLLLLKGVVAFGRWRARRRLPTVVVQLPLAPGVHVAEGSMACIDRATGLVYPATSTTKPEERL